MGRGERSLSHFRTSMSRHTSASAESVIAQLVHPRERPRWQPEILTMRGPDALSEGATATGTAHMMGFRVEGQSTIVALDADVFEEDVIVGVRMRIRYTIVPQADGAIVTHELDATMPGGAAGRILTFFLKRRLKRMQARSLKGLAAQSAVAPRS